MSIFILLVVFVKVSCAILGPEIVIAERGSSVNITCRYATLPLNIHGRKFWCKISGTLTGCSTIISSTPYVATAGYKDRTQLVDSPANGTFQVEMAELMQEDGGNYRCGIGQSNDGFFSSVFLAVSEGPNSTDRLELVSGELHRSISVRCRFPEARNKTTYWWCKMRRTGACRILADTEGYMDKRYTGRLLVLPEDTGGVVNILTNQLTPEDAGWYRCGNGTFRGGGRWKDVQVVVSKDTNVTDTVKVLHGVPGGSVATECHYDTQVNYEQKYWCKWRGTGCTRLIDDAGFVDNAFRGRLSLLSELQTNGTYTLLLTDLRAEDAGWYWCVAISGRSILTSSMELQIHKVSTASSVLGRQMTSTSPFPSFISMEEKRSPYYGNTIGTTDTGAMQESTMRLSTTPTDETRGSISAMDSRGRTQSPPSKSSFTRNSNDPKRGVTDAHLIESSNYTNFKEGSQKSKQNLLLVLVPSLLLGLLLTALGFFAITKAWCMKHRVRQPVDENRIHVALQETKFLQKSTVGGSPDLTGEKENDLDHEEVAKGLMEATADADL